VDPSPESEHKTGIARTIFLWLIAFFVLAIFPLVLFWPAARAYLQAASVLTQLDGKPVPKLLRPLAAMPITTRTVTIPSSAGTINARLYTPVNRLGARGLVLVPGVHYLGMDEPRLMAFARSLAGCGLRVLTPEMPGGRDYRIVPGDVTAIGDSAQWLARSTGQRVGLMGLSFSGGLALMAAAQVPYSDEVSFVFSVGAHDDMFRVATFYTTDADPLPDGDIERETPNNYGPWILEYEHLEDFVRPADVDAIRAVFRARLYDNAELEKQLESGLTPEQKMEYAKILDVDHDAHELAESNKKHAAEMAAVSPHGHLAGLHVPVYLLHGRGDNLIPFAEAEWLAQDLPRGTLEEMLISPLVGHVTVNDKKAGMWSRWKLLHLLARVIQRAEYA
jgi:pimeloyl-ACP methyl ester carboxylesterase